HLQIEGRAADNLEHVGGGGLLLQRFGKIVGTLPQLIEQTGVLNCDDDLPREIAEKLDLLIGERRNLLTVDYDRSYQLVVFEHRHADNGASACKLNSADTKRAGFGIGFLHPDIGNVNHLPSAGDATDGGARHWMDNRLTTQIVCICRRCAM